MPYGFLIAFLKSSRGRLLEPQLGHVELQVALVEETHDDLLAEQRGQDADAEVHLAVGADLQLDAAVLRQAALGDVERRHDLQAAGHRVAQLERRPHLLLEDAVDAEPHAEVLLVRLDVDVRRLLPDRRQEDGVAQLHDRRLAGLVLEVDDVDRVVGDRREVDVLDVDVADHRVEVGALVVVARQRGLDGGVGGDHRIDVVLGEELELVDRVDVRRVGHRDDQRRALAPHRDDLVLLADVLGDELEDVGIDLELGRG
jgi:hypothetical protein